ncbi:cytochrome c1 heme lyase [Histoplasma capsulatum]|uniref:Cytochrome c1 heme lyase n=1 Tax=Ajellomyces capsulatus TaxID=5037 RepID=A0A8A1MB38_AJECA|nr:cytochrome c1 heme lyase [Histoplasma capsulatum]
MGANASTANNPSQPTAVPTSTGFAQDSGSQATCPSNEPNRPSSETYRHHKTVETTETIISGAGSKQHPSSSARYAYSCYIFHFRPPASLTICIPILNDSFAHQPFKRRSRNRS